MDYNQNGGEAEIGCDKCKVVGPDATQHNAITLLYYLPQSPMPIHVGSC